MIGLILGVIALAWMAGIEQWSRAKTLAVIGIVICGLCLLGVLPDFIRSARYHAAHARDVNCMSNMVSIRRVFQIYEKTNEGRFPPPERWNDVVRKSIKIDNILICPSEENRSVPSYAMNAQLKGLREKDIADPSTTVMLYESIPGKNMHGGPELLPKEARHGGSLNVVFADGIVKSVGAKQLPFLNWNPKKTDDSYPTSNVQH